MQWFVHFPTIGGHHEDAVDSTVANISIGVDCLCTAADCRGNPEMVEVNALS